MAQIASVGNLGRADWARKGHPQLAKSPALRDRD
jgi:hypothetical protein